MIGVGLSGGDRPNRSWAIVGVISYPDGPEGDPVMTELQPLIWRDGSTGLGPKDRDFRHHWVTGTGKIERNEVCQLENLRRLHQFPAVKQLFPAVRKTRQEHAMDMVREISSNQLER